jgi:signal transduction histidine kinase
MVQGFVEQSGGKLEIDTSPGKGTAIRLLFPRLLSEAPQEERLPRR